MADDQARKIAVVAAGGSEALSGVGVVQDGRARVAVRHEIAAIDAEARVALKPSVMFQGWSQRLTGVGPAKLAIAIDPANAVGRAVGGEREVIDVNGVSRCDLGRLARTHVPEAACLATGDDKGGAIGAELQRVDA